MENAIKINGQYESIEFHSLVILTKGKSIITLKAKLDNNEFADYTTIPSCNKVTKLDAPFGVVFKLVSKLPFKYDVPFIQKYHNKLKIEDFLYEITYGNLDYNYAKQNIIDPFGGCSSIRNGNFFGRNFDWLYNNDVLFVVHTPSSLDSYGTIGVAGMIPGITKDTADLDDITVDDKDMYKLLPFYLLDGINERGVFCTHNLVPLDDLDNPTLEIPAKKEEKERLLIGMLVRYVLDKFASATEAINYITNYVTLYFPGGMIEKEYQSHFMIGDNSRTYIVEFVGNELLVKQFNYITNFLIIGINFNKDNTIIYPNPSESGINLYGKGLERWNIISNNYRTSNTKQGMQDLLNLVKFSNCYTYEEDKFWYSEITGMVDDTLTDKITVDTPSDFCSTSYVETMDAWDTKDRNDPKVSITCHSSVYDIKCKKLYLKNQEGNNEFIFEL